jgi:NADH dehydrogenase FAD-containing subunit
LIQNELVFLNNFHSLNYQYEDHAVLSLRSWANIVYGKMTAIDRQKKLLVVNTQKVIPYDHLILCTGLQYYKVAPYDAHVYNYHTKQELRPTMERILFGKFYSIKDKSLINFYILR